MEPSETRLDDCMGHSALLLHKSCCPSVGVCTINVIPRRYQGEEAPSLGRLDYDPRTCEILNLKIDPAIQRQGVGSVLVEDVKRTLAQDCHCPVIHLFARSFGQGLPQEELVRWYQNREFRVNEGCAFTMHWRPPSPSNLDAQ